MQSDLSRYRARRLRVRLPATSLELGAAITWEQALSWSFGGRFEADDGWYVDDIQVTNTLTSAATVSVD